MRRVQFINWEMCTLLREIQDSRVRSLGACPPVPTQLPFAISKARGGKGRAADYGSHDLFSFKVLPSFTHVLLRLYVCLYTDDWKKTSYSNGCIRLLGLYSGEVAEELFHVVLSVSVGKG